MFKAHGSFDAELKGRVLCVVIKGGWNLETALEYRDVISDLTAPLNGLPWALITDVNEWELFTPDCYPVISELVDNAIRSGLAREAIVNAEDSIKLQPFKIPKPEFPDFEREFFRNREDAESWLAMHGFE